MQSYIPPAFSLYEFSAESAGVTGPERRWFAHWDGKIGEPAVEVVLAWSRGKASAAVCTSSAEYDRAGARLRAAHLALGGTLLPIRRRPQGPEEINQELARLRDGDRFWARTHGLVPEARRAEAAFCDGYALAYTRFDGGAVFIAAVGVRPEHFRVRVAEG